MPKSSLLLFFAIYILVSCSDISNRLLDKISETEGPTGIESEQWKSISNFINLLKSDNKSEISKIVHYPLRRNYPLRSIKNRSDFLDRYDLIFDTEFKKRILRADQNKSWSLMGLKGLMFHSGVIWLGLEGTIIAINNESKGEKAQRLKAINLDKLQLNRELRKFYEPVLEWRTKSYTIRVDQLNCFSSNLRYASWSQNKSKLDSPDLVLSNGTIIFDGNGGSHHYIFHNGNSEYKIYIYEIRGPDAPRGILEVSTKSEVVLSEDLTSKTYE